MPRSLAVWLAAAVLLAACGSAASSPTPQPQLITPAQALQVLQTYNAQNNKAITANSVAVNNTIEGGVLEVLDDYQYALAKEKNTPPSAPIAYSNLSVDVPHQSGYPAFFLGTESEKAVGGAGDVGYLFEQTKAGGPWLAVAAVHAKTGQMPSLKRGSDGYGTFLEGSGLGAMSIDSHRPADALAAYVTALVSSPSPSVPDVLAPSEALNLLVGGYSGLQAKARTSGDALDFTATADATFPTVAVATADGGYLEITGVSERWSFTPSQTNQVLIQGKDYGWGLLAQGDYSNIIDNGEEMVAFQIPASGHSPAQVSLTSFEEGYTKVTGVS